MPSPIREICHWSGLGYARPPGRRVTQSRPPEQRLGLAEGAREDEVVPGYRGRAETEFS
jgi:hypothetical protein